MANRLCGHRQDDPAALPVHVGPDQLGHAAVATAVSENRPAQWLVWAVVQPMVGQLAIGNLRWGWAETGRGHKLTPCSVAAAFRSSMLGSLDICDKLSTARVIDQAATISRLMPRPTKPPELDPRQPKAVLGWTMRQLREATSWSGARTARAFGCSPSHISRVERGTAPSRELVQFYEQQFEADGQLLSLFEVVEHNAEQGRRRSGGHRPQLTHAVPGDTSTFMGDTIPHGTLMARGEFFEKKWQVRNSGSVPWVGRQLERQGPRTGPGLITSERFIPVPDTKPGKIAKIVGRLRAPSYDCTSIAYFKMVRTQDDGGLVLCFPEDYQLGLDVLVMVRGENPDL
jgi:transcriptional regulator with XRE-family HTH domain